MSQRPKKSMQPEFPPGVDQPPSEATRREFMRWASVSAALGGLVACGRPPNEKRYPYNDTPPELTPGIPQHYATAHVWQGYATGLVVQTREGRPIKVEGNPQHPASLGATGPVEQALVFEVYDPRRLQSITRGSQPRGWEHLAEELQHPRDTGVGLRFLIEPTGSPLRIALLQQIRRRFPDAKFCFWSPTRCDAPQQAARRMAGAPLLLHHDMKSAKRVLSLDADFMDGMPFALRHARHFADNRRVHEAGGEMNRLYMAECKPSSTGSLADERVACRSGEIAAVVAAVLAELAPRESSLQQSGALSRLAQVECGEHLRKFAIEAASDLSAHRGEAVVIAGDRQPWPVHVLAHAINARLSAFGNTAGYTKAVLHDAGDAAISVEELVRQMQAGEVTELVIGSVDPVYALPPALGFADALERVNTSVYLGMFDNATSQRCTFVVPEAHSFESWGDAAAFDGTVTFQQPLLQPVRGAHTLDELLAVYLGRPRVRARELLHEHWLQRLSDPNPRQALKRALQLGLLPGTEAPRVTAPSLSPGVLSEALEALVEELPGPTELEVSLHESPCIRDGRHVHNPWLQELPEPNTKLTWGNALMMSPALAQRFELEDGDEAVVHVQGEQVRGPVIAVPGHADRSVSIYLGYGQPDPDRPHFDPLTDAPDEVIGFNGFVLRSRTGQFWQSGATLKPTGNKRRLARTQDHFDQHDRDLAIVEPLEKLHEKGHLAKHMRGPTKHLFVVDRETTSPPAHRQWGMVIDQTVCTGCSACVVACQAENNIPVVGEVGVEKGREMHWLRIDRYYVHAAKAQRVVHQPMLCQHCAYAPCEYVCPVNATVHSPDGLNEMIYNRCIGTRFCSNNCPYKVRRFNWFDFVRHDRRTLQHNPEVTVRERGVMEKCTYCVQRIRRSEIDADLRGRSLGPDGVVTACQQACPTQAIAFGDIADPDSTVSKWRERPHQYAVLHEQGTDPRTRYLVKLVNPGPEVG